MIKNILKRLELRFLDCPFITKSLGVPWQKIFISAFCQVLNAGPPFLWEVLIISQNLKVQLAFSGLYTIILLLRTFHMLSCFFLIVP